MIQKKKFCLDKILKGGLPCPNAKISWILPHSDCMTSACNSCTDECIELTLLDGCDVNCVHVVIECPDCDSCPPQTFKICFCNNDDDCGNCEVCSEAGVCVEKCEHCDPITEQCGECSGGDCPGDLECIQGKCQCPPGSTQDGNICRYCTEDSECGPCSICTEDGKCVPKDCGSGVCDPNTGECVGCINSGHCGPNEVCDDGTCVCAPGYVYDPLTKQCVPKGPCETDGDCGPCMKCTEDGCVPRECPDGYICYNDDCVKICNCDEPSCDRAGHGCQRISSDICACLPCEDEQTDCNEIPCKDGTECPTGYGCKDGVCVKCSTLDCATGECDDVLGCECLGTRCIDSDNSCGGTCSGPEDCGEGCGCLNGKCVSCDNFDCESCADVPGCACADNGRCEDDGAECNDTFEINKRDDNCAIEGILATDKGCQCNRISMGAKVAAVTPSNQLIKGLDFVVELRKGDADQDGILNLPLLSQTGVVNEVPLSGNLRVRIIEKKRSSSYTVPVAEDVVYSQIFSFAGTDTIQTGMLNFNPPGYTKIDPVTGETVTVGEVEIQFLLNRKTLNFENSCSYSEEDAIIRYRITANGGAGFIQYNQISGGTNSFRKHAVLESASNRNPLFTWYKSDSNGQEEAFRTVYATEESPGFFRDGWISVDEGVEIGKFYRLESDCACNETEFYRCPETGAISKLRYCNPNDLAARLVYDLKDCNKTISLKAASNTFSVCRSNSVGRQVYELWLNDRIAGTFTASNGTVVFSGDYTAESSITKIEVKLQDYNCEDCYEPVEITPAELTVQSIGYNCENDALEYSISGGSGNYSLTVDGIPTSMSGPISLTTGDHILVFLDNATGCSVEQGVNVNCCADLQVNAPNVQSCTGTDITVTFDVENGIPPYAYTIANELNPIKSDVTNNAEVTVVIPPQPSGLHAVQVIDGRGCEAIKSFNISASANPAVSIGNTDFCAGVTTKEFTATATGGTAFTYEIRQGGSVVKSGTTSGQINETLNTGGSNTYTLVVQNQTGCQTETSFSLVSISCPDPEVTMNISDACEGKPLTLSGLITGGTPPYNWSIFQSGVSIGSSNQAEVLLETGTSYTSTDGTVNFSIEVSDANDKTITENFSITVLDSTSSGCIDCGEPVDLSIDFLAGSEVSELGENIILTAVGGDGTISKYVWLHNGEQVGTGISFIPPQSVVGEEYYTLRYGEAPCYQFTDPQRVIISEEECDCTPTIKVISGIEGLNGKNVTTFNQNSGEDVCVGTGKTIKVEAVFSSGCSGTQVHTWRVRRRVGFITVQEYNQSGGNTLTYQATNTGNLTIDLTSEDQTTCIRSAEQLRSKLVTCETPDPFYVNLSGSSNICKVDAGSYSANVVVSATKVQNYLNCNVSCYDTFPFTYKVKRGSTVLASGQKSGGWTNFGTNSVPVTLNLSPYNGIITLTVEVTRTDTNETVDATDNINVRSANDPMCDVCQGRTVTATITQGSQVEIYEGSSVTLSGSGSSPAGISSYSWRRKSDNAQLSTSTSFSVSPSVTTDYTLTVTDSDGCEASDTIRVVVNEPCPPMNLTLTTPGPQCPETNVQVFYGVPQGLTAQLSVEGQSTTNVTGSGSRTFPMGQAPVAVSITATDSCGETKTVNKSVQVDTGCDCGLMGIAIVGPTRVCPGSSVTYTTLVQGGDDSGYTYTWFVDNVQVKTGTTPADKSYDFTKDDVGDEVIRLEVSKAGCDTRVTSRTVGFSFGDVAIFGFTLDGTGWSVAYDLATTPSGCYTASDVDTIDSYVITVQGYSPIDVTSQSFATPGNSNWPIRIDSGSYDVPGFNPSTGYSYIKADLTITFNDGVVYSGTEYYYTN